MKKSSTLRYTALHASLWLPAAALAQAEQLMQAQRATALTRQLLAYSRKQMIQRRPLALNDVVEQTVA